MGFYLASVQALLFASAPVAVDRTPAELYAAAIANVGSAFTNRDPVTLLVRTIQCTVAYRSGLSAGRLTGQGRQERQKRGEIDGVFSPTCSHPSTFAGE